MNKKEIAVYSFAVLLVISFLFGVVFTFIANDNKTRLVVADDKQNHNTLEVEYDNQKQKNNTSDWKIYKHDELGLMFSYPQEYSVEIDKEGLLDSGRKLVINLVSDLDEGLMSFVATSPDYKEGVGEGCCYDYSKTSIDLTLSENEIKQDLSSFSPTSIALHDDRIEFIGISEYASLSASNMVLIPVDSKPFSNVLVKGPSLIMSDVLNTKNKEEQRQNMLSKLSNKTYLSDKKLLERLEIYNAIIDSIEHNTNKVENNN